MSMQTDEAYRLFCNVRNGDTAIEFFFIDAICYCLFDDYEEGAAGYERRQLLRRHRPSLYEDMETCASQEEFEAIIAQYKLEGV